MASWGARLGAELSTVRSAAKVINAAYSAARFVNRWTGFRPPVERFVAAFDANIAAQMPAVTLEEAGSLARSLQASVAHHMGLPEAPALDVFVRSQQELAAHARKNGTAGVGQALSCGSGAAVDLETGALNLQASLCATVLVPLLAHELVHVCQRTRLETLQAKLSAGVPEKLEGIRRLLMTAVLEGTAQTIAPAVLSAWAGAVRGQGQEALQVASNRTAQFAQQIRTFLRAAGARTQVEHMQDFVYGASTKLARAVTENGDKAGWSLFENPPLTLQEVIEPSLYLAGVHPPHPKPLELVMRVPHSRLRNAFMYGLGDGAPKGLREAWRGDWKERVETKDGHVVARAFLFDSEAAAESYLSLERQYVAEDKDIRRTTDSKSALYREGNVVISIAGCPAERFDEVNTHTRAIFA
ncbi:MAG: hypothetical protein ACKVPX_18640 [Myxococcaceae bacterium]